MYATDFIYDGEYLSDYNFVICSIDSSGGVSEISAGSEITFNQTVLNHGNKHSLTSTKYDSCVSAVFDICKDPDYFDDMEITETEYRKIMRWLNRKRFKKFCFRTHYDRVCYYNASFNITNIYVDDVLYGFRLKMSTDKPYGYGDDVSVVLNAISDTEFKLDNLSDEIDYLNPKLNIKVGAKGDLYIINETYLPDYPTIIKNCTSGEEINIDCENQIIESTNPQHDICNDFNYKFFKLGNSYHSGDNEISILLPCTVTITYKPIIKNIN